MLTVNEASTAYLTIAFVDGAGAPAAPVAVAYWIHDLGTGAEVRGETAATPGASVTITLTPTDNTIVAAGLRDETRVVTIIATYGDDDQVTQEERYTVRNLLHVPPAA